MVLTFKGDKKPKKRKRTAKDSPLPVPDGQVIDDAAREDDSWVSAEAATDIAGPVMLVFPTQESPWSLACDTNGTVFTKAIENIVDGIPSTAEPHEVRQVWLASRIVGSPFFRLKAHHGKYLGCREGTLSATSDAVAEPESFRIVADTPGTFRLQTSQGMFVATTMAASGSKAASTAPTVVCGNDIQAPMLVRMQARYKPRIKASKEEKAKEKISRRELEDAVGRRLEDDEVRVLKRARREGDYHERVLDLKVKDKHDKYG